MAGSELSLVTEKLGNMVGELIQFSFAPDLCHSQHVRTDERSRRELAAVPHVVLQGPSSRLDSKIPVCREYDHSQDYVGSCNNAKTSHSNLTLFWDGAGPTYAGGTFSIECVLQLMLAA